MRSRVTVAVLLALVGRARAAAALDPAVSLPRLGHRVWTAVDGLPSTRVTALLQARDRVLWVGTADGVMRFDGLRFRRPEGVPLAVTEVAALLEARDGALWVASDNLGVRRIVGGVAQRLDLGKPARSFVRALAETPDGAVWIGTAGGLVRWGKSPRVFGAADGLPRDNVRALAVTTDGALWVGTPHGLAVQAGDRFTPPPDGPASPGDRYVHALHAAPGGDLWAATHDGLFRLAAGHWRRFGAGDGLPDDDVWAVTVDGHGVPWAGSARGAARGRGDAFVALPAAQVRAIHQDDEGNVWFGDDHGLHRLSDVPLVYGPADGIDGATTVTGAPDGALWIGFRDGGVGRFDGASLVRHAAPADARAPVSAIAVAADGTVFATQRGGACVRLHDGQLVRTAPATTVHVGPDGAVYAGGDHAGRFADGGAALVPAMPQLFQPTAFQVGPAGQFWAATWFGLFAATSDGARVREVTRWRMPTGQVTAIHQDGGGAVWLGTTIGGLLRVRAGAVAQITADQGLPSEHVSGVAEDAAGRLWIVGSRGVYWARKRDLDAVADGAQPSATFVRLGGGPPEVGEEGRMNETAWRAADGTLWFASAGVVLAVAAPADRAAGPVLAPRLDAIEVDGRAAAPGAGGLRLPATANHLRVGFTAVALTGAEALRFAYRMDGLDRAWTDAGDAREARWTSLPPGAYTLRVRAEDLGGRRAPGEATLALIVAAPFFRTRGFLAGAALAAIAVALALHRLRVRRLRATAAAVLAERTRIAREVHDTLAQTFSAISLQLDSARQALPAPAVADPAREAIGRARDLVLSGLAETRRAIVSIRSGSDVGGLGQAFEEIARRLATPRPIAVRTVGTARVLPPAIEHGMLRIGQEALTNAVRHARAQNIEVELLYEAHRVQLRVRDDGAGGAPADPASARAGGGVAGMYERAREIGGMLAIVAGSDGTEVRLEVPQGHKP